MVEMVRLRGLDRVDVEMRKQSAIDNVDLIEYGGAAKHSEEHQ